MLFKRGELVELKNKKNPLAGFIGQIIHYQADTQKYLVQFSPDQNVTGLFRQSVSQLSLLLKRSLIFLSQKHRRKFFIYW